jgi:hypothetical protein
LRLNQEGLTFKPSGVEISLLWPTPDAFVAMTGRKVETIRRLSHQ